MPSWVISGKQHMSILYQKKGYGDTKSHKSLEQSQTTCLLGIILDEKPTWEAQMDSSSAKISS